MAKANETWTVLPHDPIEKLGASLWRVQGDLPGMPMKRVMTIVKRADGTLVIHNAMALEEGAMKEIDAWGEVAFLLVPNGWHRLDAKVFAARYPRAKVLCPRGSRKKVAEVVEPAGSYDDFPADDVVSLETLDGTAAMEGVMTVKSEGDTTLVLNDAVFNMPHLSGVQGWVLKHITQSSGGPRVSRVAKLFMVKDKAGFAAHLERLAATPDLKRVIVAHHQTITADPAGTLRGVAASLRG
jgi:hypothetical protein